MRLSLSTLTRFLEFLLCTLTLLYTKRHAAFCSLSFFVPDSILYSLALRSNRVIFWVRVLNSVSGQAKHNGKKALGNFSTVAFRPL